jgi:hypothetical protein
MQKTIRRALIIAVIYFAGSYVLDRPKEVMQQDAVALQEMSANLPQPKQVAESVRNTGDVAGDTVWDAKKRLDTVRGKVQDGIALGTQRFTDSN